MAQLCSNHRHRTGPAQAMVEVDASGGLVPAGPAVAGARWSKVRKEYMKPSTAKFMGDLFAIGLKSIDDIDRETQSAGGNAEKAAEQALAAIRAFGS